MTTFDQHITATGTHNLHWHLVTGSQYVEAVCDSIGFVNTDHSIEWPEPIYGHLYVRIGDGEYTDAIACEGSVPWIWSEYDVLRQQNVNRF